MSDERGFLDRLRDWAQGRLDPTECAKLEAELDQDFDKERLAEEYGEVEAWLTLVDDETEAGSSAPRSQTSWEDLARRLREPASPALEARAPLLRGRWLAAAALLLGGTIALALGWGDADDAAADPPRTARAELHWIPTEAQPAPDFPEEAIAALLAHRADPSTPLVWHDDPAVARQVVALSGRPLLEMVGIEGSPALREAELRLNDRSLTASLAECVLSRVVKPDLSGDPKLAAKAFRLHLEDAKGRLLRDLGKPLLAGVLPEKLELALEPLELWRIDAERQRDWAAVARDAWRDEGAGRLGSAWDAYGDLKELGGAALGPLGLDGERRIAQRARRLLEKALRHPEQESFLAELRAAQAFRGTPFAADFATLEELARDTGEVPVLEVDAR